MNQDSPPSRITAFLNHQAPPTGGADQPIGDPNRIVIHCPGLDRPIEASARE
jgi:hypothetical protein